MTGPDELALAIAFTACALILLLLNYGRKEDE